MPKLRSKSEYKRRQILEAATKNFTEHGFSATSMSVIAKRAGVSKQTVYSHFGNKDELFCTAITTKCGALGLTDLLTKNLGPAEQTLQILASRFFEMITSSDAVAVHRICTSESLKYPHLAQLFFKAGPEYIVQHLELCFSEYNHRGELYISNAHHAAVQFLAILKGEVWDRLILNVKVSLTETEIKDYLESSVALFVRGYKVQI